jgi:hypothetical protein
MEASGRTNWKYAAVARMAAAVGVAAAGCGGGSGYYYDPYYYGYDYYYPADIAYADVYYADDVYGTAGFYALGALPKQMTSSGLLGGALRDLASGQDICPGHATTSTTPGNSPCSVDGSPPPARTSIVFNDCQLADRGRLTGTIQIDATQTPSDTSCTAATVVEVRFTSIATNLTYTAPSEARVTLPTMTVTASYARSLDGPPATLELTVDGKVERYDEKGTLVTRSGLSGTQTLVPLGANAGYRLSGTMTMDDAIAVQTRTASSDDLTRTEGCCYPTSGVIEIAQQGGETDTWRFGPDCGAVSVNDERVTLDECF